MKTILINKAKPLSNKIKTIPFQVEAVNEMIDSTNNIINNGLDSRIILSSTVGSGKTVMGAIYMDKISSASPGNYTFVWVSPGTGSLHNQSRDSIKNIVEYTQIKTLDDVILDNKLSADSALFVNWESIKSEDNIVRREGEKNNLDSVMKNTDSSLNIIVMIDETHQGADTKLANEVIGIFAPKLVIGLSATPKLRSSDVEVSVPAIDVINSGRIKKGIRINQDFDLHKDDIGSTIKNSLLNLAFNKRDEIENEFRKNNNDTIPLVLIQIGNEYKTVKENETREYQKIVDYLLSKGVHESEIAVWLSDVSFNDGVEDINTNGVKFLIFKQAIATGWDCPRSHVLVRFRDVKSFVFDIQTAGRILRTNNGKHYNNDVLDYAYVYTDDKDYTVKINDKSLDESLPIGKELVKLKESFIDVKNAIKIPMEKISRELIYLTPTNMLNNQLIKNIGDVNSLGLGSVYDSYVSGQQDVASLLDNGDTTIQAGRFELTTEEINKRAIDSLTSIYQYYDVYPLVYKILSNHNDFDIESIEKSDNLVSRLYLFNQIKINAAILKSVANIERNKQSFSVELGDYVVRDEVYYKDVKMYASDLFLYEKEVNLSSEKSNSEEPFADFLNQRSSLFKFWFKNGISKDDFSIAYDDEDGNKREYYPDFIIGTNDNKLHIVDVKAKHGDSDYANVQEKYEAGLKYQDDNEDVVFSIIKLDNGTPTICVGDNVEDMSDYVLYEDFVVGGK